MFFKLYTLQCIIHYTCLLIFWLVTFPSLQVRKEDTNIGLMCCSYSDFLLCTYLYLLTCNVWAYLVWCGFIPCGGSLIDTPSYGSFDGAPSHWSSVSASFPHTAAAIPVLQCILSISLSCCVAAWSSSIWQKVWWCGHLSLGWTSLPSQASTLSNLTSTPDHLGI